MPMANDLYYCESCGGDANQLPVVLVHGISGDHRSWPIQLRRLSGRRVLAVDLPGHGHSEGRPRQSIEAYAQDLAGFLEKLGVFRVVLVGHGLGAMVALQATFEHPERVAGLGLISASAHLEAAPAVLEYFCNPLTLPLGWQWFRQNAFSPQTPPTLVEACVKQLQATRPAVLAGDWSASTQLDLSGELAAIRCPAWVAYGVDDRLAPPPCAHYLAAHLNTTRLQLIPAAGHMAPFEQPACLVEGLRAFLADLSPLEPRKARPAHSQPQVRPAS